MLNKWELLIVLVEEVVAVLVVIAPRILMPDRAESIANKFTAKATFIHWTIFEHLLYTSPHTRHNRCED